MKTLILPRQYLPNATRGHFEDTSGSILSRTIERAKDDPDHPCVAEGTYLCEPYDSPRHGRVWMLTKVMDAGGNWLEYKDRQYIEIHICRDPQGQLLDYVRVGFLLGCIGPGLYDCEAHGEPAVCGAPEAFRRFMEYLKDETQFTLIIRELKETK